MGERPGPTAWPSLHPEDAERLLDVAQGILCVVDSAGRVIWANDALDVVLGYSPEAMQRTSYLSLIHPDDLHLVVRALTELDQGIAAKPVEVRARHRDGSWRWFRSRTCVDDGRIYVSVLDVTADRHLASQHLDEIQRLAQFAEATSHDLLSPLTNAIAALNQLTHAPEADMQEFLAIAARNLQRADALTRSFLALARGGRPTLEPVSMADLVEDAVVDLPRQLDDRLTIEADCDVVVAVDRVLGVALLRNLITNAARHGSATHVTVTAERLDGERVLVAVADDGPGVPEAFRETLFDWGQRTQGSAGFGLGLAIVRRIVEAHGGTIWVDDNEPTGARFSFSLPAVTDVVLDEPSNGSWMTEQAGAEGHVAAGNIQV